MRLTISIIMIVAAVAGFAFFIVPHYHNVSVLRAQVADYNTVLQNANTLQAERNQLVQKYNAIDPANIAKLGTMLPANPQNVALILELSSVASQYGLTLQNVKVDASPQTASTAGGTSSTSNPNLGTLGIQFSLAGSYNGFVNFLSTIERSLRIIDVNKVSFTTSNAVGGNYQYSVGINTYWLK
jgi:Tfp pilus assembly protein PilO